MILSLPEDHPRLRGEHTVPGTDMCRFLFVVGDVPGQVGDIFGVEVGNRGSVNFEVDDEMTSVTLTLS